jgi:hypothetical protein
MRADRCRPRPLSSPAVRDLAGDPPGPFVHADPAVERSNPPSRRTVGELAGGDHGRTLGAGRSTRLRARVPCGCEGRPIVTEGGDPIAVGDVSCPGCGVGCPRGARFCRLCGASLPVPTGVEEGRLLTRRCPSCGIENHPGRELCGACGVDLDTGALPPRPRAETPWRTTASTATAPSASSRRPSRRTWLVASAAVAGTSVLVALAVLAMTADPELPEVPPARFVGSDYPDDRLGPVVLDSISTLTSRAPADGRDFDAANAADQDPASAWHADAASVPEGAAETIDLFLDRPAWIAQLVILNGDHLDGRAYESVGRIQRARITFDGGRSVIVTLLDQGRQAQVVELPEPVLTTSVRVEVLAALSGTTRADVAISDLELWGWLAVGDDTELARERAAVLPAAAARS